MTVHVLTIDSRDRNYDTYPDPANYRVFLPRKYRRVTGAKILSAEFPTSFYVFRAVSSNTTLPLTLQSLPAQSVVIPDGNYGADAFAITLEDKLREDTGLTWRVRIDQRTMRLTMGNDERVDFVVGPWSTTVQTEWGLGFHAGFDRNAAYQSANGSLTAPKPVQLNPVTYLMLDIEELNGLDEGGIHGSVMGNASFAKIPVQVDAFEYAFLDSSKLCSPLVSLLPELPTLDRLRIRVRYHDGQLVDFRGVDHSFTVELHTRDPSAERPMNTGSVIADAASAAAATAAAAAVTATQWKEREARRLEASSAQPPPSPPFWKVHGKHVFLAVFVAFGIWYFYKKRRVNVQTPHVLHPQ